MKAGRAHTTTALPDILSRGDRGRRKYRETEDLGGIGSRCDCFSLDVYSYIRVGW